MEMGPDKNHSVLASSGDPPETPTD